MTSDTPPIPNHAGIHTLSQELLNKYLVEIETHTGKDLLSISGAIDFGVDHCVRVALEGLEDRRKTLLVILDTPGGSVEAVERIAETTRYLYQEVEYLIPDRAMSAGTVLVMSGDKIYMDYYSCLGPIDPQVYKDGRWVPANSYLRQYERLIDNSKQGSLTTAELVLLEKLDLAELHQFELAAQLSIDLIEKWLAEFKFKNWRNTESRNKPVTKRMRLSRAKSIAKALNDHEKWASHGRGIHMKTLTNDLKLMVDDYSKKPSLKTKVWNYYWFLGDYLAKNGIQSFVHSRIFM